MSEDIHKYPSQLAERFQVRMPDGLRDRIAEAAKANNRSMNSEIVARLQMTFDDPPSQETIEKVMARLDQIEAKLKARLD